VRICLEMQGRVDFHVTSYRHSHDEAEKVWITLDGSRIATYSWYQKQWKPVLRDKKGRLVRYHALTAESQPADHPAWAEFEKMHLPQDFGAAMRMYLDLTARNALHSTNPLVRALAVIDRRVGKRSIQAISMSQDEDPLVQALLKARLEICRTSRHSSASRREAPCS
jgi:hypothetical protein